MKRQITVVLTAGVVFAGLVVLTSSAFIVRESEQAVVTQFGEIVRTEREAGLFWKKPFVQDVYKLESRILEFDGDPDDTQTNDKKPIQLDTFARWRIEDPQKFFETVRTEREARSRLDAVINSSIRESIASYLLVEAVRNSNRPLTQDKEIAEVRRQTSSVDSTDVGDSEAKFGDIDANVEIQMGRQKIVQEILDNARSEVAEFGIQLVDVKIKRINYGATVQESVFERMRSDRQQIAQKYLAEGQEERQHWLGRIDQEQNEILSNAYKESERIKGEGDAEAARIYAEAYGADPEFYAFWKTLQIYRDNLGANSTLVVSTDSDLFHYLHKSGIVPMDRSQDD